VTRLPRPDFLARPPRPGLLAWVAAGTGALVLALVGADVAGLHSRIAVQQARLQDRLAATDASAQAAPARTARAPGAAVPDARAADAEARALRRIGYPWQQLFTTLEEATPAGVQWLALDHGTDRADLRLAGQARDAAQAVALVDALAAWAGWSDVVLRKLAMSGSRSSAGLNSAGAANTANNVTDVTAVGTAGVAALFEIEVQFDAPQRRAIPAAAPTVRPTTAPTTAPATAPTTAPASAS
jgi:hypothetical protein